MDFRGNEWRDLYNFLPKFFFSETYGIAPVRSFVRVIVWNLVSKSRWNLVHMFFGSFVGPVHGRFSYFAKIGPRAGQNGCFFLGFLDLRGFFMWQNFFNFLICYSPHHYGHFIFLHRCRPIDSFCAICVKRFSHALF